MKKIFLLILGFVMFKVGYSQYPIQQFIGADSAVVTSKGGLQGRFINVVFADTTAANSQRVRQYPGAMIYASGKLWVRNTTATAWNELAYNITPVNIYNSDGTLTGPRTLDGSNDDLTFDNMGYFTVNGNPLGQIRFYQGSNSNILMRGDTTAISRRLSYNTNLGSSFTKHSLVDKNYVDSSISTVPSVNIYNSDGTLTGNRELDGDGNNLTFTAVRKFSLSGDSLDYTLDPAGNLRIGLGNQQFIMRADTASLSRRLSYTGNLGSSFTKHTLVDKNYVDSSITASPSGTVTSVGLSMPTAFAVANSPVISSGTLTVTGAGVASQYIRGDGQLATLPTTGGGGSSVSYYLNGSVNQGTFGGTPYYEMSKTAIFGAGTDFTISSNGYIASFITDAGDPALLNIPAGNWDFEVYFQSSSTSGTPSFYVELYKYDGSTFTLIASSSANPEFITGGTSVDAYYTPLAVPSTSLLVTDRLAVRIYVNNSGNTITLHTEDNNLCQIITTFSTGINALNGLTSQVQYLATGTSGTDFNISSLTDTHTFNLPTASATNRGALSSADWTTFNSKIGPSDTASMLSPYLRKVDTTAMLSPYKTFYPRTAISLTTTGTSGAATYDNSTGVLNVPQYADQFTGTVTSVATNTATGITGGTITTTGTLAIDTNLISTRAWRQKGIDSVASLANSRIGGSGTTNYVSKFTASGTIGNSQIFDNGTNVGIGTASPATKLTIFGTNPTFRVQGDGSSYYGGIEFYSSVSGSNRLNGSILQWDGNGLLINAGTGMNLIFRPNNGTEAMRLTSAGRLLIGTTTESTYELDLVGDFRSTLDANINGLTVGKGGGAVSTNTAFGVSAINATASGTNNVAVGYSAGSVLTSGSSNVFVGTDAGRDNTTGSGNVFVGRRAGVSNVAGSNNTIAGFQAGFYTTSGGNSFYGYNAGTNVTTGGSNTYIGNGAGEFSTTAEDNATLGLYSLRNNTTGLKNVAVGVFAGRYLSAGTNLTVATNSIFIGYDTRANANSESNQIVIGHQAIGNGSNSVTIGNSSITKTILQGNVGILTTSPTNLLTLVGSTTGRGIDFVSQANFATVTGKINYETTNDLFSIINASSWGNSALIFGTNNTERARFTLSGRLLIGTSTESTYILDANGTVRVQGTELRLDNGTTGTINIYSNTPKINFFSGGGYSIGRTSTSLELISGGNISFYIGANQGYGITAANGHIWYSANSGSAALARLDTGGSLSIGKGTTAAVASSILELSSTTKGFLPPVMTGAQAELISSPATGLMVYANNGNGATITSTGWWGYNGTTWVKLN